MFLSFDTAASDSARVAYNVQAVGECGFGRLGKTRVDDEAIRDRLEGQRGGRKGAVHSPKAGESCFG